MDTFYDLPTESRQKTIWSDKATNYGVVRPELLDRMYENMYHQRLREADQNKWQCKIVAWRQVIGTENGSDGRLRLKLKDTSSGETSVSDSSFDLAILGTWYERNGHETLLKPTRHLLREDRYAVERDYKVVFRKDAVASDCGIWLQGCCEDSHGVGGVFLPPVRQELD